MRRRGACSSRQSSCSRTTRHSATARSSSTRRRTSARTGGCRSSSAPRSQTPAAHGLLRRGPERPSAGGAAAPRARGLHAQHQLPKHPADRALLLSTVGTVEMKLPPRSPAGPAPRLLRAGDANQAKGLLLQEVERLLDQEAIAPRQLALLCVRPLHLSSLSETTAVADMLLVTEASAWRDGAGVLLTTPRRFKGLEADVVVVFDIDDIRTTELYVACTRARSLLVMVSHSSEAQAFLQSAISAAEEAMKPSALISAEACAQAAPRRRQRGARDRGRAGSPDSTRRLPLAAHDSRASQHVPAAAAPGLRAGRGEPTAPGSRTSSLRSSSSGTSRRSRSQASAGSPRCRRGGSRSATTWACSWGHLRQSSRSWG